MASNLYVLFPFNANIKLHSKFDEKYGMPISLLT